MTRPTPLIAATTIEQRVAELASRISADHNVPAELLVVGVLKGAYVFLADLARRLTIPHTVDFITLSTYGDSTTPSQTVRIVCDLTIDVAGRHLLIVDDIIDTGATLAHLKRTFAARGSASIKSCVLLSKDKPRPEEAQPEFVGFEIDDVWVVGYGLDHSGRYRSLPYVGTLTGCP